LGAIRLQARQRSDLQNNNAVTDSEFNGYISNSYKELYDMLVGAYGNDYYIAQPYQFTTSNSQSYPLPDGSPAFQTNGSTSAKFYKLLGADLQYSASPSGWVTLRRLEFIERNKMAYPNTQTNWIGYTNLRYRIQGNSFYLMPVPMNGQTVQIWYVPAPTSLQFILASGTTIANPTVTMPDTTGLQVGMNAHLQSVIPPNTTILSVASTSVTLSANAYSTNASAILSFWSDSTTLDGISGWEEFVIVDAAIKAQIKQENDINPLLIQKQAMKERIEAMAEARDAGQAFHVSDVLGTGNGSDGYGGQWGGGWDGGY
jgi:hypothetical protein